MAVDDLYQLTVNLSSLAGPWSFGQAYKQTAGTNDHTTLGDAVTQWGTDKLTLLENLLSEDITINRICMEPWSGVDEVPGFENVLASSGAVLGDALPNNVAAIISQLTDAPNSKCNGRIFMAGISELGIDSQVWTAAQLVLIGLFATEMEEDIDVTGPPTATFAPVVVSLFLDGVPRVTPVPFDVIDTTAKSKPRQQRRRTTRRFGLG